MSDPKESLTLSSGVLSSIAQAVAEILQALAPFLSSGNTNLPPIIAIAMQIIQGVIALEPAAIALWEQIMGGTPPTPAQLAQFISTNETANAKTDSDIAAALARFSAAALRQEDCK